MHENIKNLPYINMPVTGGLRHVFILPFYNQNEWKTWIVDHKKRNDENNLIGLGLPKRQSVSCSILIAR